MIILKNRGGGQSIGFIAEEELRAYQMFQYQKDMFEFFIWHGYVKPGWRSY